MFSHMTLKPMGPEQLFDSLLTATSAHKAGGDAGADKVRDEWLKQFVFAFANDEEGEESSSFQGTIPQALMMMNGELMASGRTGGRGRQLPGSDLCVERAQLTGQRVGRDVHVVNQPLPGRSESAATTTPIELGKAGKYLEQLPGHRSA